MKKFAIVYIVVFPFLIWRVIVAQVLPGPGGKNVVNPPEPNVPRRTNAASAHRSSIPVVTSGVPVGSPGATKVYPPNTPKNDEYDDGFWTWDRPGKVPILRGNNLKRFVELAREFGKEPEPMRTVTPLSEYRRQITFRGGTIANQTVPWTMPPPIPNDELESPEAMRSRAKGLESMAKTLEAQLEAQKTALDHEKKVHAERTARWREFQEMIFGMEQALK